MHQQIFTNEYKQQNYLKFKIMIEELNNNTIRIFATVGVKPEIRTTPAGRVHATCRIISFDKKADAEGNVKTEKSWHTLSAWGPKAEFIKKHFVEGRKVALLVLQEVNREYTSKEGEVKTISLMKLKRVLHLGELPGKNNPEAQAD